MSSPELNRSICHLLVLRSYGPRLAKQVTRLPDGSNSIEGYERAKTFRSFEIAIDSCKAIAEWLERRQGDRRLAVIRAKLLAGISPHRVRRTLHEKPDQDGILVPQYFEPARRCWVAIDIDGVNPPADLDIERKLVGYLLSLLPPEFAGADLVLQMTGSAGFKAGVRARLWFWLDRPTSSVELHRWFAGRTVDLSTFRDVQLIYTARPVLIGVIDPHPRRVFFLPGAKRAVEVPDLPEPPRRLTEAAPLPADTGRYVAGAVERAAAAIAHTTEGGRHALLNREAFALARFVQAGEIAEADLVARLTTAARQAGLTDPDPELTRFIMTGIHSGLHRSGA